MTDIGLYSRAYILVVIEASASHPCLVGLPEVLTVVPKPCQFRVFCVQPLNLNPSGSLAPRYKVFNLGIVIVVWVR